MNEERVFFQGEDLRIEGLLADAKTEKGAVISHPNPMMGGTMRNNVVESLVFAFFEKGFSTLRFNFRGVGRSEGDFDEGAGEQDDLASAVSFIKTRGIKTVSLAGYSFGAWVTANYLQTGPSADHVVLVAPPVSVYRFPEEAIAGRVDLIICGDRDPFCRAEDTMSFAKKVCSKIIIIPGADHFFAGKENQLIKILQEKSHFQ